MALPRPRPSRGTGRSADAGARRVRAVRVAGIAVCCCGLVLGGLPAATAVGATPPIVSTTEQLRAQRTTLVTQLGGMAHADAVAGRLAAVETRMAAVNDRLLGDRGRLGSLNQHLLDLSRRILADEHTIAAGRTQLASLLRVTYEVGGGDGLANFILAADTFSQTMDRMHSAQQLLGTLRDGVVWLAQSESALVAERATTERDFSRAMSLESGLADESNRMLALVAERDALYQQAGPAVRALMDRITALDDTIAAATQVPDGSANGAPSGTTVRLAGRLVSSGIVAPVPAPTRCADHFAFGQCTYYVATRRCIPWFGDAYQWWANAAAYGYPEGRLPRTGAVAVWAAWSGGAGPYGHVAYVEAVGPTASVPAGFVLISEMNWGMWDHVDTRVIPAVGGGLLGYVYAP